MLLSVLWLIERFYFIFATANIEKKYVNYRNTKRNIQRINPVCTRSRGFITTLSIFFFDRGIRNNAA